MRTLLWLVLLFLAGCGGGGGSTEVGGASTPIKGFLSLQVAQQAGGPSLKNVSALAAVEPSRVRIVVSNPAVSYREIIDLALGESLETIPLPPAAGYQAELVYYKPGTPNVLTHYGAVAGISIISESTTLKAATMRPIEVAFGVPDLIMPGTRYDIAEPPPASLSASGLQPKWILASSYAPFTSRTHLADTPSSVHTNLDSTLYVDGPNLFFQGEFFLKPELLAAGESYTNWAYVAESGAVPLNVGYVIIDLSGLTENVKPVVRSFSVPQAKSATGLITPIAIVADDNGAVGSYLITETPVPPAREDTRWRPSSPTSYTCATVGLIPGQDTPVTLYVWVKDYCGNVSDLSAVSQATVIINPAQ